MKLKLTRPIIFFDLETTGLDLKVDRIVEMSIIKVKPDGSEVERTFRFNPGMHIPEAATAVHGIKDEDVANEKTFAQRAPMLAESFRGCDIAGYNSDRFDVPMLAAEFERVGVDFDFAKCKFIDVQTIYHKKEPRNLIAAYRLYCDKDLENAHSANADTRATYEVLMAQLDRYDDLQNDVNWLADYSKYNKNVDLMGRVIYNDEGVEVINFGKHKGKPVVQVLKEEPSYYAWIMDGDFPKNTKDVFTRIKLSMRNK